MFRHFNPFRQPTLQEVKQATLRDTEMALYDCQLQLERAQANVAMYQNRLNRLKADHDQHS